MIENWIRQGYECAYIYILSTFPDLSKNYSTTNSVK